MTGMDFIQNPFMYGVLINRRCALTFKVGGQAKDTSVFGFRIYFVYAKIFVSKKVEGP